jgi:phosphoribosylformylglycinamidine cyclo-ligase
MSAESYLSRGVSPTKEDVHKAIANQPRGVFPGAFCMLVEDLYGDSNYCVSMHADGAGTKSCLAYIYYKETGDVSVFGGIAQDSIVMNIDDLLCVGAAERFIASNTIGRNAHRIDGGVLKQIIEGYQVFGNLLKKYDINLQMAGGETADVGDLVSTIIVDSTIFVRLPRAKVVHCANISPGDVIVGLTSFGQAVYENSYNSGIGSNGLTAARHLVLSNYYAKKYPETYSNTIAADKSYCGRYKIDDALPGSNLTIGQALLSPTRTYAPIIKDILTKYFDCVHGIIHCTGGGQVKCRSFGHKLHYIKDNLFETPPIFKLIENDSSITPKELYQIFNMGHRMEIYCKADMAEKLIEISKQYNVDAKVIGRVEKSSKGDANTVTIKHNGKVFQY